MGQHWTLVLLPWQFVDCCWLLSLLGTVILGCMGGHVAVGVGELQASHHSSVAPSGHLRKPAKLVGNCSELPQIIMAWWSLLKAGAVHLSCGCAHILVVSAWGFALWLLGKHRGGSRCAWGLWTGLGWNAQWCIHAAVGLWCLHVCWSLVKATELEMRRGPLEGHENVLYPCIGTCLSA